MSSKSQSFTEGEIELLAYICNCLLKSQEPSLRIVQSHKAFQPLARKCISMKQKLKAEKSAKA